MKNFSKIKEWVTQGLISQDQADRIVQYEGRVPASSWPLISFITLGAIIICVGIVSMVAVNWEKTPASLKLIVNFTLLIVLGVAAFINYRSEKSLKYEVLLLSFILFCISTIALIGQIFHTSSDFYKISLFWAAITAIAASTTQRAITWIIWFAAFLAGVFQYYYLSLSHEDFALLGRPIELIGLNMLFLLIFSAFICIKYVRNPGLIWALCFWSILFIIFTLILNDVNTRIFLASEHFYQLNTISLLTFGLANYGLLTCIILNRIQKILGASILILLFCSSFFAVGSDLVQALFSLSILGIMAVLMASLHKTGLFNLFMGLLFIRFMIVYFQALGGLAATGAGLIIAGIIIISFAIWWKRSGKKLLAKIEGWTNAAR